MQETMTTAVGVPAPYPTRPCAWCILYRPGRAPNFIRVAVENSDGICPECQGHFRNGRTAEIGR